MSTAAAVVHVRLTERLTDVAIAAFLWTFRIVVLFIVGRRLDPDDRERHGTTSRPGSA